MSDYILGGRYRLDSVIRSGGFGTVWRGVHVRTNQPVAIKIAPKIENISVLMNETRVMLHLMRSVPIPKIRAYGEFKDANRGNYIVMDLLGECVTYENVRRRLVVPTSHPEENNNSANTDNMYERLLLVNIYSQLIRILERIHDAGLLYRDVKPSNFLFGKSTDANHKIYIVDFGLVKRYTTDVTDDGGRTDTDITGKSVIAAHTPATRAITVEPRQRHIEERHGLSPIGTHDYMSVRVHEGTEASRRDDMESLGYMFYYLQYGELPWASSGFSSTPLDSVVDHAQLASRKRQFRHDLKSIRGADNMRGYFETIDACSFKERPNYEVLRKNMSYIVLF